VYSGAPEGYAVTTQLVAPVMLLLKRVSE